MCSHLANVERGKPGAPVAGMIDVNAMNRREGPAWTGYGA